MSWKEAYRHGSLLLLPPDGLRQAVDDLRARFDPASHETCTAHITLTQPLLAPMMPNDADRIAAVARSFGPLEITFGPVETLGHHVVVFRIEPRDQILRLRAQLHRLRLFDLSQKHTKGFVPHMTISERGDLGNLQSPSWLTPELRGGTFRCEHIHHLAPDADFVFQRRKAFPLFEEPPRTWPLG